MPGALFRRLEGPCPLWRSRIIGPSDRARVYARPDDLYESGEPSRNVLLEYNKQPAITLSACLLRTDSTKTWHIGDWLKHSARRVSLSCPQDGAQSERSFDVQGLGRWHRDLSIYLPTKAQMDERSRLLAERPPYHQLVCRI